MRCKVVETCTKLNALKDWFVFNAVNKVVEILLALSLDFASKWATMFTFFGLRSIPLNRVLFLLCLAT